MLQENIFHIFDDRIKVIVSLTRENISVFAFLCNREKFSAQPKGLFLQNKRKMPQIKDAKKATFANNKKRNFNRNEYRVKIPYTLQSYFVSIAFFLPII